MGDRIQWSKETRDTAASRRLALFAFGVDRIEGEGVRRFEAHEPMDPKLASALMRFMFEVLSGKHPTEAFEAIDWDVPAFRGEGACGGC